MNAESADSPKHLEDFQQDLLARMAELRASSAEILRSRTSELRRLEELCWEQDAEIVRLNCIHTDLQKRIDSLREASESRLESCERYVREISELKVQAAETDSRIQKIHEDYGRKLVRLSDKTWEKDLELQAVKSEHAKVQAEIEGLKQIKTETEKQLTVARSEIESLKRELNDVTAEMHAISSQSKIDSRQASHDLIRLAKERDELVKKLEKDIAHLRGRVHVLQKEREKIKYNIQDRSEDAKALEITLSDLRLKIDTLRAEHRSEIQSILEEHRLFVGQIKAKYNEAIIKLKSEFEFESEKAANVRMAENAELAAKYESKIQSLIEKHDSGLDEHRAIEKDLNAEILRMQNLSVGKDREIADLLKSNQHLFNSVEEQKTANENLIAELKSLENKLVEKQSEIKRLEALSAQAEQESLRERSVRERLEHRIDECMAKNSELQAQLSAVHDQMSDRNQEIDELNSEISSSRSEIEALKSAIQNSQRELERMKDIHADKLRETQLVHLQEINEEKLKRQSEALDWAQRLNLASQTHSSEKQAILRDHEQVERQLMAVKSDSSAIISQLKNELEQQTNTANQLHQSLIKSAALAESRISQITAVNDENTKLKAKVDELTANLEKQMARYSRELFEIESKCDELTAENANLKVSLKLKNSNLEENQKEFEIRCGYRERQLAAREKQMGIREMQLKHYANSITEQKSEFVRQTKMLAEEVLVAAKMHPLRDFLKMTEFELSRVEVQLKLTPSISSDRAKLEAYFEKMIEQRDFLKKVVEESEKNFADQAQQLLDLIRSPKMSATPPPPPTFLKRASGPTEENSQSSGSIAKSLAFDPVFDN